MPPFKRRKTAFDLAKGGISQHYGTPDIAHFDSNRRITLAVRLLCLHTENGIVLSESL